MLQWGGGGGSVLLYFQLISEHLAGDFFSSFPLLLDTIPLMMASSAYASTAAEWLA